MSLRGLRRDLAWWESFGARKPEAVKVLVNRRSKGTRSSSTPFARSHPRPSSQRRSRTSGAASSQRSTRGRPASWRTRAGGAPSVRSPASSGSPAHSSRTSTLPPALPLPVVRPCVQDTPSQGSGRRPGARIGVDRDARRTSGPAPGRGRPGPARHGRSDLRVDRARGLPRRQGRGRRPVGRRRCPRARPRGHPSGVTDDMQVALSGQGHGTVDVSVTTNVPLLAPGLLPTPWTLTVERQVVTEP
ncbi:hypothetical protein NKG05_16720 [Oerskovia sp. M15]